MRKSLLALSLLLLFACNNDEKQPDFKAENEKEIAEYIAKHDLNAQKSSSGLYYIIDDPGTGTQPSSSSTVTVAYKGYFTNGTVFDESKPEGISFNLQDVIPGWTEGVTYFKEGGSGMLLVPAHLGYGNYDDRGIPGGSVLIFEVELIEVEK